MTLDINPPIRVGDTVYLPTKDSFNFFERYTRFQEYTVNRVKLEYDLETNLIEWYYSVEGKSCLYKFDENKTAFTKEQLYESFREELEALIPEDIRKYLWS